MSAFYTSERQEEIMKTGENTLKDYTKIVVETDEENPITIAEITADNAILADGYSVRLTPTYD